MHFEYETKGTCSRRINFDLDDNNVISNVSFEKGCNGNLKGISALVEGKKAEEIIKNLKGINCNDKGTSCPDQLAKALEEAINSNR